MAANGKNGKRARQKRALVRLQERMSDNQSLYNALDRSLMVAEGPLRERTIAEMNSLDREMDRFEKEEASLCKNLGLAPNNYQVSA